MAIAIVDYGMGNLRSVQKAFDYIGADAFITNDADAVGKADKVVLPGVGAFDHAMDQMKQTGLDQAIREACASGVHLLGICLGLQLLFEYSEENGHFEGLSILPGKIVRIKQADGLKVPHMGWNALTILKQSPLFTPFSNQHPFVYFVHAYHVCTQEALVSATTVYGQQIQVGVQKDNVMALQFHPEKSGDTGLSILGQFAAL